MIGDIYKKNTVSAYQPTKEVADITNIVRKDYEVGHNILNKSWVELNNRSVLEDRDRGQLTFNAFVDESIEDPASAWQWRGTRSKARNKAIQMHAHLASSYIIPMFMAQDDDDEEDRDFADLMRDAVEWMITNSNYRPAFFSASMGMLVNPVTYLNPNYNEVFQKVKVKKENGEYSIQEILDEVLSGFQANVLSCDQVLISNAYEQNIQRHRFNIIRHYIEYGEAYSKYGQHEHWQFVSPGIKSLYNPDDGLFYDVKDDDHPFLVEEVIYKNRRDDTEIVFINGIYFGDNDVELNPIKHRDNRNAPKYNVVPYGYQRIGEHFFFYKSLMNAQYWDNMLLDEMYKLGMNRAFLDVNMPIGVTGMDKVDSDIVFPSSVTAIADPDAKVFPILPPSNMNNLFAGMQKVEESLDESSVNATTGGQLPDPNMKATAILEAKNAAATLLQGLGQTLAESTVQIGNLMSDIVLNHITVPQVEELAGGANVKLKYKTLLLNNKSVNGKEMSRVLRFDDALLGREMSKEEKEQRSLELLKETGYPKSEREIYLINPLLFSRRKYLARVEPQRMFPENEEYRQSLLVSVYNTFRDNPFVSLESLTRKTMHAYFRSETDEIMKDEDELRMEQEAAQMKQLNPGSQVESPPAKPAVPGMV